MRATSEIKLSAGTMAYGRNLILVWNVTQTENGYEYDSIEVPKNSSEADIMNLLEASGIDSATIHGIMQHIGQDATGVING